MMLMYVRDETAGAALPAAQGSPAEAAAQTRQADSAGAPGYSYPCRHAEPAASRNPKLLSLCFTSTAPRTAPHWYTEP